MKKRLLFVAWLTCCGLLSTAWARQSSVTGKVTDASDGSPLSGVTISVQGSNTATATDANGNYSINVPGGNATLVFQLIGYGTQQQPVGNRKVIDVTLQSATSALDEVIVVAYGTATRASYTGSAATVSAEDIADVPTVSFENAMLGKLPGVQITNSSGQAGAAPSIRIRGIGSMNASNEPLYVIDGVPVVSGTGGQMEDYLYTTNNVLNSLNPSDIESVTVLKDAAASALYGSRAANGVVVITTKKGKLGRPTINFRTAIGFTPSWATDNYEPAGVQEQVNMLYQVFHDYRTSAGWTEERANTDALNRLNGKFKPHGYYFETDGLGLYENVHIKGMTDGLVNREGSYYDWEDRLFRTGMYQTNDLSVSGGTEATKYYTSLSYTNDKNRVVLNEFDRIAGRVNVSQKVGKHIEFISNVSVSHNQQEGYNDTRNLGGNYYLQTRNLLWPLYWPTDYKTGAPWTERYGSYAYNGDYYENEWDNQANTLRLSVNETLNIQILPELSVKSVFSYEHNDLKEHLYYSTNHYTGVTDKGIVHEISTAAKKMVSSNTANYSKQFGLHGINLLAGFEVEQNRTDFQRATGTKIPNNKLPSVGTAGDFEANAYFWGYNMMSVLSRAEYNYGQKYNLSASYRRDGSSRLAPADRWGDFWSVGAAWTLSEENFLKDANYLSNLRLRASYGVNGTQPTNNYDWRRLIAYNDAQYMGNSGGMPSAMGNEDLTWETNYTTNVALEFGFLNNRLYGTVEYFNRNSENLLQEVPISLVTGFEDFLTNVGEVNNRGFELDLGYDIVRSDDWKWSANVNASFIRSKVTKLYGNGTEQGNDVIWNDPTGDDARAQFIYREGEDMLSFYGFEWAGVEAESGRNVWYVNDPEKPDGDFLYNGRGASYSYSDAQRVILGSALPDVAGGLNTEVSYKGLSLGLNFIYKIGGYLYDGAFKDVADDGYYWERIRSQYYYEHMWTDMNPDGDLPKLSGNDLTDPMQHSSRQMHDASFLRLKNVNLAYAIPAQVVNRIGIANARVYFNGTNLLTFSEYKIADPEVNHFGTRGWETPYAKVYTFGVEFSF